MNTLSYDILTHLSYFFSGNEAFLNSRISKQWQHAMEIRKKKFIQDNVEKMDETHTCSNLCPCFFEEYIKSIISDFMLKKMICNHINGKETPEWLNKYI